MSCVLVLRVLSHRKHCTQTYLRYVHDIILNFIYSGLQEKSIKYQKECTNIRKRNRNQCNILEMRTIAINRRQARGHDLTVMCSVIQ